MKISKDFTPKLFTLLKQGITKKQLTTDIVSGIVVGIVALPLAIAFAIASGVSPEKGLITAVVAGFAISAFGGSRVQIGGPTGAFIVIVFGIVATHGVEGLVISTFMAGFIIIGLGLAKIGNYLKFVPYPLIVGFTSGIAVIIFSSQMNDLFGMNIEKVPGDFIGKWELYFKNTGSVSWYAFAIGAFSILATKYFYKISSKIPGSLVAILVSSVLVWALKIDVATIETKFGSIPSTLSMPHFPNINLAIIRDLIQPAFAIAILGAIESLLSAVVADGMIGGKHRPNMELVAQGGANILSGLFGGIPATGAIARTAVNVKNGGRTPIAGITHAVTLLLIMMVLAPYAKLIPLSSLAGILVVVAYNMSEWRQFRSILKSKSVDVLVLLTTFFLTVVLDLIIAIEVGMVLASVIFMKRMSDSFMIKNLTVQNGNEDALFQEELNYDPKEILLYEISGPLFFGAAQQFQEEISEVNIRPKIIIIRMRYVPFIDSTGYHRFKELIKTFKAFGTKVLISGVQPTLFADFEKNGMFDGLIKKTCVFETIDLALNSAQERLAAGITLHEPQ